MNTAAASPSLADQLHAELESAMRQNDQKRAASVIRRMVHEGVDMRGRNVTYSHILMLAADWPEMSALVPSGTNVFHTSGWLNSLYKGFPVDAQSQPLAWWTYPCLDYISGLLQPEWRVFEWGSGYSTCWWGPRVASVNSVEDDHGWFERLKPQLPDNAKVAFRNGEEAYVGAIREQEGLFDAIVVDGSHRNACAEAAIEHLTPKGVIIFDNTDMAEFDAGVEALQAAGFFRLDFWGQIPCYLYKNCTSLFLRDPSVLRQQTPPSQFTKGTGLSCAQAMARNQKQRF